MMSYFHNPGRGLNRVCLTMSMVITVGPVKVFRGREGKELGTWVE